MNNNKNPNLPDNAIASTEVVAGTRLARNGLVVEVRKVVWAGHVGIVYLTNGERIHTNRAGTLRLA